MKTGKKKALRAAAFLLAIFILINAGWYVWRLVKYGSYVEGMERNEIPEWLVPRYKHIDAEGYDYSVKYPDYLSFTGNLCVGLPAADENPFTDFLVIWPKVFGGYEYGVSVSADGQAYQIYVDSDGSAVDPAYNEIADSYQEEIDDLLHRAQEMWDLE